MITKQNLSAIRKVPLIAAAAVIVIAGVAIYAVQQNDKPVSRESAEAEEIANLEPISGELLTPERVKELAATESPNVEINGIELEREDNAVIYKVKLANGTVIYFDAKSGNKVNRSANNANEVTAGSLPAGFTTVIDFNAARDMATTLKPDGTIRKIHLQMEDGIVVYSIRFSDNARIDINAADGSVVRNDPAPGQSGTAPNNDGAGNSGSSSGRAGDDGTNPGVDGGTSGNGGSGRGSDD